MAAGAADGTMVMVVAALTPDARPCEPAARDAQIEATLLWGPDVLAVRHVDARAELTIGDLDLALPRAEIVIADVEDGRIRLVLPNGERVPEGTRMTLRLGRAALRLGVVARERKLPRETGDGRVMRAVVGAALVHAAMLACAIVGRGSVADEEASARATMEGYLAAAEARAEQDVVTVLPPSTPAPAPDVTPTEGSAPAASPEPVAKARAPSQTHRARTGVDDPPSSFGILALLAADETGTGASAFATELGPSATGSIFGASLEDAAGFGGLGLSGIGEGGGGKGAGVPLDGMGGSGTCDATCMGRLRGVHRVRAPVLRCDDPCTLALTGRLPPEAVQRVVRENFGRLRSCYEAGLVRDAGLEGRIRVKFVIDREGDVAMASTEDRSLPDASVASCVASAFGRMTFPRPAGGIVTVSYPIVFSTSP